MPLPILEQIAENVEATLRGIRLAAGYNTDALVERRLRHGNKIRDNLLVIHQDDPPKQDGPPQQAMEWLQPFQIMCYCIESEDSTIPIDRRLNLIEADVEKAMMVDYTRGGLAVDTIPRVKAYFTDTDTGAEGIIYQFDVQYRTAYGDPFTGR